MITRRYRLDDINEGYRDLLNGEIIRGVIDFALGLSIAEIDELAWSTRTFAPTRRLGRHAGSHDA